MLPECAIPIVLAAASACLGGCSSLSGKSKSDAQVLLEREIPQGTDYESARTRLDDLGASHVSVVWHGWPPPAPCSLTAEFDSSCVAGFLNSRRVLLEFGDAGDVVCMSIHDISAWMGS